MLGNIIVSRHTPYREQLVVAAVTEFVGTVDAGIGIHGEQVAEIIRHSGVG